MIRTNDGEFSTDDLLVIDRQDEETVVVITTKTSVVYRGLSARQVWAQVNEHSEYLENL